MARTAYKNDAKVNDYSQPGSNHVNNSEVALANLQLGIGYMNQGLYEEALGKLNRAREAKPDYSHTYNALGVLYQKLGDYDVAEANFKMAIKLNPADSSTLNNYRLLLCQSQRFEEADATFSKAANNPLYATPVLAYTNAGTCALNNGQTEQAENYFKEALRRNAGIGQALIQMSKLSYEQRKYLPARVCLSAILILIDTYQKVYGWGYVLKKSLAIKMPFPVMSYCCAINLRNQKKQSYLARHSSSPCLGKLIRLVTRDQTASQINNLLFAGITISSNRLIPASFASETKASRSRIALKGFCAFNQISKRALLSLV